MGVVNEHLARMKCAAVAAEDIGRIKSAGQLFWTDDVIKSYRVARVDAE
jgi:hypothetical protein